MENDVASDLMADAGIRHSDVDGFTIVQRNGRRPTIHLLRPWNECNTEKGKSGADTVRVEGGTEQLAVALSEMGYQRGGVACKRCFRYAAEEDVYTPVEEYENDGSEETLNRRETLASEAL